MNLSQNIFEDSPQEYSQELNGKQKIHFTQIK